MGTVQELLMELKGNNHKSKVIKEFHHAFRYEKNFKFHELIERVDGSILGKNFLKKYCTSLDSKDFNVGFYYEESLVERLFKQFPSNSSIDDVLCKVAIIDELYGTRLDANGNGNTLSLVEMSERICKHSKSIDCFRKEENPVDLVEQLANKENYKGSDTENKNNAHSFASKYLSFALRAHGMDKVPITDKYVRTVMANYHGRNKPYEAYQYKEHYNDIVNFQTEFGNLSFKQIDVFLWIIGKARSRGIFN